MIKKNFYVVIDRETGLSVTMMPTRSLCQDVIKSLPERSGYLILRIPTKTLLLDFEFAEELSKEELGEYYSGIRDPLDPKDWYGASTNSP